MDELRDTDPRFLDNVEARLVTDALGLESSLYMGGVLTSIAVYALVIVYIIVYIVVLHSATSVKSDIIFACFMFAFMAMFGYIGVHSLRKIQKLDELEDKFLQPFYDRKSVRDFIVSQNSEYGRLSDIVRRRKKRVQRQNAVRDVNKVVPQTMVDELHGLPEGHTLQEAPMAVTEI